MKILLKHFLLWSLACLLTLTTSGNAALSPFYESLSEYQSLLKSQELTNKLGSAEGIRDIKRTDKGFIITTYQSTLNVDLIYDPQEHPGPAKFHFVFHEVAPKP